MIMSINKSKWNVDGNQIKAGFDISKVDRNGRMVYGWATIDNEDTEGDVVTAAASVDAFTRSRMNLREMHKKDSAVGKIVSFKEKEFLAPDGTKHNGIFVKVRVSKGAEDTWQKVLDSTLSGFSIGGEIVDAEEKFAKSGGSKVRYIHKYDLNELSLVDNPGNQYSDITNIFKIRKSADGSVTASTGLVEDFKILNVFYCDEDAISTVEPTESETCPACDAAMANIGIVDDKEDREERVKSLIAEYIGEGGEEVTDSETVEVEEVEPQDVDEVEVEKSVDSGLDQISKKIDDVKSDIENILTKTTDNHSKQIEELEKSFNETRGEFTSKLEKMQEVVDRLETDFQKARVQQNAFEKRLREVDSSSAIRKSAGMGNTRSADKESENFWNGAFSVDQLMD